MKLKTLIDKLETENIDKKLIVTMTSFTFFAFNQFITIKKRIKFIERLLYNFDTVGEEGVNQLSLSMKKEYQNCLNNQNGVNEYLLKWTLAGLEIVKIYQEGNQAKNKLMHAIVITKALLKIHLKELEFQLSSPHGIINNTERQIKKPTQPNSTGLKHSNLSITLYPEKQDSSAEKMKPENLNFQLNK